MGQVGPVIRAITALACMLAAALGPAVAALESDAETTYLVVLDGPGTAAGDDRTAAELLAEQAATRARVTSATPIYSWTSALNGYAVRLTPLQADLLAAVPEVALVEPDSVHRLTSTPDVGAAA